MRHAQCSARSTGQDDAVHALSEKAARARADLGFHVPDHVLPDLIAIADPKLVYANMHAQRDRRMRLLARRYTNQIQHGCKNVNCTTPTCLSYRKRNATGPLRKYTDLSARTLACQLVEDCTRLGKDPLSELCQNEPVVPWYEDPGLTQKRRSSVEKGAYHRQENGYATKPVNAPQRPRESGQLVSLVELTVPGASPDGLLVQEKRRRTLDLTKGQEDAAVNSHDVKESTGQRRGPGESPRNEISDGTERPQIAAEHCTSPRPAGRQDMASFTQILFDLIPVRLLHWFPPTNTSAQSHGDLNDLQEDLDSGAAPNLDQDQAHGVDQDIHHGTQATAAEVKEQALLDERSYALRTLTWRTLPWLRLVEQVGDQDVYHRRFLPFLRQTLTYCLGEPERLLSTVRDLQQTCENPCPDANCSAGLSKAGNQDTLRSNPRTSKPGQDTSSASRHRWPTILTSTRADVHALLSSFVFLDTFNQRDLVLNNIMTVLQQSYHLPPWLEERVPSTPGRSSSESSRQPSSKSRDGARAKFVAESTVLDTRSVVPAARKTRPSQFLDDEQVTELCLVAITCLAAMTFNGQCQGSFSMQDTFIEFAALRNCHLSSVYSMRLNEAASLPQRFINLHEDVLRAVDTCEDWSILRLLSTVMDVISHRLTISKWTAAMKAPSSKKKNMVDLLVSRFDRDSSKALTFVEADFSFIGATVVEFVRTVMLKKWDRSAVIERASPVGGALEVLAGIYRERRVLNLDVSLFHMKFVIDAFDELSMPMEWLTFRADNRQMHLLSFPFLFGPVTLLRYFRAINIESMRKSHESATLVHNNARHYMWSTPIPLHGAREVLTQLRPQMAKFLVLTIRRDDTLNDAIDQIWRRQRKELMRPLRVRLGRDEGEDGLDHGGVQQEFFRIVFAEALNPDYGMFAIDNTTRMTWFQPGSHEQPYKFEALGILMSIAVYNGITLPVTFPLAFYRKLLGLKVKRLEHIADGWPVLTKSLKMLMEWQDGDVGDVIARTYEFSYEHCGQTVTIDMQKHGRDDLWHRHPPTKKGKEKAKSTSFELPIEASLTPPPQPSPSLPSSIVPALSRRSSIEIKGISTPLSLDSDILEEAELVTNANRERYVMDYILWLTHKSIEQQYAAFAKGFYTCLDRTALSIFTPENLKDVIEGHSTIDIDEWEQNTTYEEYDRDHQTVVDFWHVVRGFSVDQHKQLLTFVTASDRVPVNGIGSITFIVQKNGDDDNRLPSSSTCYGRLLLPQYSNRQILEEKLTKAIENSVGFGTL